jgi:heme A synthase
VKLFRVLALGSAVLAWLLAVVGSWTRINGAGLACPDWPLCKGVLIPALQGGVVLEMSHRAIALTESFAVAALVAVGFRLRRELAGVLPLLAALLAVFGVQVVLGGATVLLGNNPVSVMFHWGTAMLLLAVLVALALLAVLAPRADGTAVFAMQRGTGLLIAATLCAFLASCLGALVSSGGAGLACPNFPGCDGGAFGQTPAQHAQMAHRLLAAATLLCAFPAVFAVSQILRPAKIAAHTALAFLLLQIALGVANVVWSLPIALREAHAANAGATFSAFVVATLLASYARKTASGVIAAGEARS